VCALGRRRDGRAAFIIIIIIILPARSYILYSFVRAFALREIFFCESIGPLLLLLLLLYTRTISRVCVAHYNIYIYTHTLYTRVPIRTHPAYCRTYTHIICISRLHCFPIVDVHCTPALFLLRFIFLVFLVAICAVDGYILLCRYDVPYRYISGTCMPGIIIIII